MCQVPAFFFQMKDVIENICSILSLLSLDSLLSSLISNGPEHKAQYGLALKTKFTVFVSLPVMVTC